jgi:hypothetical protein
MSRDTVHVVELRLTSEEWDHVSAIARLRELTVEELLREELRMSRPRIDPPVRERSHLRIVAPHEAADTHAAG